MADARVELGEQGWRFFSGLHRLLLRLAGRVPDEWLDEMRRMLAGGDLPQVPDAVMGSMVEFGEPLTAGDVALIREIVLAFFGRDPVAVDRVRIVDEVPVTGHRFFPAPAEVLATDAARIPPRLDLTGRPGDNLWELPPALAALGDLATRLTDIRDRSQVGASRLVEDVLSTSRAWRFAPGDSYADGVRVILVEVVPYAAAWDVAGQVRRDLERPGAAAPQIEVFWAGESLPPYHQAALAGSALLWQAPTGRVSDR
ncbi:hypothetical protein QLQ12_40150 [Actinoplanes sp. NEAU-A12]|uniref:Uncharacterized protein n=1 Tax=Actinoplanes sandaracinus TaxID=3045177 RepID=A0ABT6WYI3_9ACTN|nr:hypothetical protein [Actinoplanes sandaracinus]MDI6104820.1 hypothetical protein [Actinoplanes sandaracinus]